MYAAHKSRAAFYIVYILEAHPSDGWQMRANVRDAVVFKNPRTESDRAKVAKACQADLKLDLPMLIDGLDNATNVAYAAWPDRLYIVGADGRIAYKGGPGPRGFSVAEMGAALKKLLGEDAQEEK
ncbi:deiodinase [bacterium]|nr:deiodinase [bacterium]